MASTFHASTSKVPWSDLGDDAAADTETTEFYTPPNPFQIQLGGTFIRPIPVSIRNVTRVVGVTVPCVARSIQRSSDGRTLNEGELDMDNSVPIL